MAVMSLGFSAPFILDKITEAGVVAIADRALKRDRLLGHLEHGTDALDGQLNLLGHLFRGRFSSVFLDQLLLHAHQFVDRLDHVHGDADCPGLIRDRSGNRLANPPSGVGRKFVAAPILEFLDGFHQAHVAFLDQVEKREAAIGVFLSDRNHQPQIGFDHLRLGSKGSFEPIFQITMLTDEIVGFQPELVFELAQSAPVVGQPISRGG